MAINTPPALKKGDLITIVSTARFVEEDFIEFARRYLENEGFSVSLSEHLYARENQFAGSDDIRAAGLNAAIENPDCRAILCARGGYGTVRILDRINWQKTEADPKWFIGYSDVTALHQIVFNRLGLQSIHATMPVNFGTNSPESLQSLSAILRGEELSYSFEVHPLNRAGVAEGTMIGGNLSVIYSLLGSDARPDTTGKILVLEDLDEYLYHIDRMMMALDRAGMFQELAGLVVGGMTDMNDNIVPFGKTAEEIIAERVAKYHFPVAFGFPSGHIDDNRAWVHGKNERLAVLDDQPSSLKPLSI